MCRLKSLMANACSYRREALQSTYKLVNVLVAYALQLRGVFIGALRLRPRSTCLAPLQGRCADVLDEALRFSCSI